MKNILFFACLFLAFSAFVFLAVKADKRQGMMLEKQQQEFARLEKQFKQDV